MLAAGAVAATAAVAYYAKNKYADEFVDKVLKSGTEFHTIDVNKDRVLDSRFYAAYGKRDRIIYKGLYGKQLASQAKDGVYDITTKTVKEIKAPSRKTAAEVFSNLYKTDSDFRKAVDENMQLFKNNPFKSPGQHVLFGKVTKQMTDDQLKKYGYNAFNVGLANRENPAAQKFYDKLKSMGYNAVTDLNDKKYSGFKSKNPMIVFDMDSIVKESVKRVSDKELNDAFVQQDLIQNGSQYLAMLGIIGGATYVDAKSKKAVKSSTRTLGKKNRKQK